MLVLRTLDDSLDEILKKGLVEILNLDFGHSVEAEVWSSC